MNMSPPPPMKKKHYTAMTFFWGRKSEVLFTDWPGDNRGMYVVALIVIFLLAAVSEMIMNYRVDRLTDKKGRLAQTAMHAFRVGLMNLLMLAVMSFNGGIFIAACFGHTVGFLIFRSAIFGRKPEQAVSCGGGKRRDLPSICC